MNLNEKWQELTKLLEKQFESKVDLINVLYIIGVQEMGKGFHNFNEDEKYMLIHIGNYRVFSEFGYYKLEKLTEDNWPVYKKIKDFPKLYPEQKDNLLKEAIINYFEKNDFFKTQ